MESLTEGISTAVLSGLGCKYVEYSQAWGMTTWDEVHRGYGWEDLILINCVGLDHSTSPCENHVHGNSKKFLFPSN